MGLMNTMLKHAAIKSAERVAVAYLERGSIPQAYSKKSSEEYYHKNYQEVYRELIECGFTNIVVIEQKDLVLGLLAKDGAVESVLVSGKEIKSRKKYNANDRVVITYHTFKKK